MIVAISGSLFAWICIIGVVVALGGANAIGISIASNMTTILVVISILYLIRLVVLAFKFTKDDEISLPSKIASVLLQFAESVFAVFVCYKALMYVVVCSGEDGFFGFGFEMILWALLIVAPFLFGTSLGTACSWKSAYFGVPVSSVCYLISFFLSLDP